MNARGEVFRTARDYHAALAAYVRAMRHGEEVEGFAQRVVAASLAYRRALERMIANEPSNHALQRRVETARKLLHLTSGKYNLVKRHSPPVALPPD